MSEKQAAAKLKAFITDELKTMVYCEFLTVIFLNSFTCKISQLVFATVLQCQF